MKQFDTVFCTDGTVPPDAKGVICEVYATGAFEVEFMTLRRVETMTESQLVLAPKTEINKDGVSWRL